LVDTLEGTNNRKSTIKKPVVTTIPTNPARSVNIGQELGARNLK